MKAAVLKACPRAQLVDIDHSLPAFDVGLAAFVLWAATRDFTPGTVHLAVVDPGVGSERRALAVEAGGCFYVGPDNGLLTTVVRHRRDLAAVSLNRPASASPTFEGRDVFAPAAGALAAGTRLADLGRPVTDLVVLPDTMHSVVWVDGFGNLVTNLEPPVSRVRINGVDIGLSARTFAEAPPGQPFWYVGSLGLIEVGVHEDRADRVLGAGRGTLVHGVP
jgi:S-adenosyl-L-methionine hydrolase (adenosine-forming)